MDKEVIEVKKEGGGEIILPGKVQFSNPVTELRKDFEEMKRGYQHQFEQLDRDLTVKYNVLESHISDAERVFRAKHREMIACIRDVEKLIVEKGFKT